MTGHDKNLSADDLPFDLEMELGQMQCAQQIGPGVYYLSVKKDGSNVAQEYYVVIEQSEIFQKVKSYGQIFSGLRVYPMAEDTSGWRIVDYEICMYQSRRHQPLLDGKDLHTVALFSAEHHPEYFGIYPAPMYTPKGYTLRYRVFGNGIYWIETDQCADLLAVCYPLWTVELSNLTQKIGEQTKYDQKHNIHKTLGYLFFSNQASCIPIYELMQTRPEWDGLVVDKQALMNAIWRNAPQYALLVNQQEQRGLNGCMTLLLNELGIDTEPQFSVDHMICISPDADDKFLLL